MNPAMLQRDLRMSGRNGAESRSLTDKMTETVAEVCSAHGNRPERLIEIFHDIQSRLGCIPADALQPVAAALNLSRADVYGVFSFYHDFRDTPPGRHRVRVCRAEACQAVGCESLATHAEQALGTKFGATTPDGRVTLEAVYCLGNCALGPSVMVDDDVHGMLDNNKLNDLLDKLS